MIAVLTCDIIASRRFSGDNRKKLNEYIEQSFDRCCELIPEADADKLSFSFIQGDEFQFLIENPEYAYQFAVFFRLILSLTDLKAFFRAGIGIGNVAINDSNSYKMDGSAFHRSRDAIKRFENKTSCRRITHISSDLENLNTVYDIITQYNDYLELKLSAKQKEAIFLLKTNRTFVAAAEKAKVSRQALKQRIDSSHWLLMKYGLYNFYEITKAR